MLPIPMTRGVDYKTGNWLAPTAEYVFPPQCDNPIWPSELEQGLCAGEWMHNLGRVSSVVCNASQVLPDVPFLAVVPFLAAVPPWGNGERGSGGHLGF